MAQQYSILNRKLKQDSISRNKGKVGEWVRHTSSSVGKDYYFNINTHDSVWEKPAPWLEYEQQHGPVPYQSASTPPKALAKPPVSSKSKTPSSQSSAGSGNKTSQKASSSSHPPLIQSLSASSMSTLLSGPKPSLQTTISHPSTSKQSQDPGFSHHVTRRLDPHASGNSDSKHSRQFFSGLGFVPTSSTAGSSSSNGCGNSSDNGHSSSFSMYQNPILQRHGHSSNAGVIDYNHGLGPSQSSTSTVTSRQITNEGTKPANKCSGDLHMDEIEQLSPYEDDCPPVSLNLKPVGKRSATTSSSTGVPSPCSSSGWPDSRSERDRDRVRDRDRDRGRDRNSYGFSRRNNGYSGRDRNRDRNRERDREQSRDPVGRPKRGEEPDRSKHSQRDQAGDRRTIGRSSDRDRERERGKETDRYGLHVKTRAEKSPPPKSPTKISSHIERGENDPVVPSTDTEQGAQDQRVPDLPEGLASYYRPDLIPPEVRAASQCPYEREADKLAGQILENHIRLATVSAELKMSRSLVRFTEIGVTRREGRMLFIQDRIRKLEESDENSFQFQQAGPIGLHGLFNPPTT